MRGGCAFEPVSQQELGVVLADGCGTIRRERDGEERGRTFGGHDGEERRTESGWMMGLYRHEHNNLF